MLMRAVLTSLWYVELVSGAWCSGSLYGTQARAIVVQASSQAQSRPGQTINKAAAAAAAVDLCLELGHCLALGVGGWLTLATGSRSQAKSKYNHRLANRGRIRQGLP